MKITECPRDAWQGFHSFIPTEQKIRYINQLLKVGFDTIDFGSFVSPKAMPQVSDTAQLIDKLDMGDTNTKLLAIIANERGALDAVQFPQINFIGFPFSISETFQIRNTKATINESLVRIQKIKALCDLHEKKLVIYISMGFGNPYGDEWNTAIVSDWVAKLAEFNIKKIALSDTVGMARESDISTLFNQLIPNFPTIEFGAHFHTKPQEWIQKIEAAYMAGCRSFDGALLGFGGCPMAQDDLVGNMPTENLISFAKFKGESSKIDQAAFDASRRLFMELVR